MAHRDVSSEPTSGSQDGLGCDMGLEVVTVPVADVGRANGNGWLLQEVTERLPGREWED